MDVDDVVDSLERRATADTRASMTRYGIPDDNALGVPHRAIKALAKTIGKDHALAADLWATGIYEARVLAALVDDPSEVTRDQMNTWASDFDSWAIVDHVCFELFDRTPHAWKKTEQWATARSEFKKRAAFALMWCLSIHDKRADDGVFLDALVRIEEAAEAGDDRLYVKKGINMALRAIGKRNRVLHGAAVDVATRLAASDDSTAAWIGRSAQRQLTSAAVEKRLEKQYAAGG